MAYTKSTSNNAQLLKRTVACAWDFSGRSRRTEVLYYWIACALISVVFNFIVETFAPFRAALLFRYALGFVLWTPQFALFARRLHDQGRSGWFGVLQPVFLMLSIPTWISELPGKNAEIVGQQLTPTEIAGSICMLAVLILYLLPGTEGSNRYGPDPRLEDV